LQPPTGSEAPFVALAVKVPWNKCHPPASPRLFGGEAGGSSFYAAKDLDGQGNRLCYPSGAGQPYRPAPDAQRRAFAFRFFSLSKLASNPPFLIYKEGETAQSRVVADVAVSVLGKVVAKNQNSVSFYE